MRWRVQTEVDADDKEEAFEAAYLQMRREFLRPGSEEVLVIPLDEEDDND